MAAKFWVGGTGTWDNSTTTHWSASTGGAGGAAVPGAGDVITFDGASGGGTVTLAAALSGLSFGSIAMGAFTGTLDFSVNNPNITLSAGTAFSISGTGVARSLLLGTSTLTLTNSSANAAVWDATTTTSIGTTTMGSSTIIIGAPSAGNGPATFRGGGLSYGALQVTGKANSTVFSIIGSSTFATITLGSPLNITFQFGQTTTITNAFTWAGSSGNEILVTSTSPGFAATISAATGSTLSWAALQDMTFTTSSVNATNSFNFSGNNMNGGSIAAPVVGGGSGGGIIGA